MSLRLESEWRQRALCCRSAPENFFPVNRPSNKARSQCDGCPVREECLDFVLSSPWQPSGIWAGMTAKELTPMWLQRHPAYYTEVRQALGLRST